MKTFKGLLMVLVLVFGLADAAQAQWKFGAQGGIAIADVGGDDTTVSAVGAKTESITGFAGSAYLNYAFSSAISFQSGLAFVQKGFEIDEPDFIGAFEIDYLEIPLFLRFDVPTSGPVGVHFLGGPTIGFEVGCDTVEGGDSTSCDEDDAEINSTDFGIAGGAGLTFDVGGAALIVDGVYNFGLSSLDDSSDDLSIKNRTFTVTAGFEIPFGG